MDDYSKNQLHPTYTCVLQGVIDARRFRGLPVTSVAAGPGDCTIVRAALVDPPALYGFISRLRDLGVTLLELHMLENLPAADMLRRGDEQC